mmetsp:Transcript_47120/g.86448  ORF Transcript_47120/g.86448 Transcript_47120/m.86448 type:complete len:550 (+) Transcript_47120:46-1695(+)
MQCRGALLTCRSKCRLLLIYAVACHLCLRVARQCYSYSSDLSLVQHITLRRKVDRGKVACGQGLWSPDIKYYGLKTAPSWNEAQFVNTVARMRRSDASLEVSRIYDWRRAKVKGTKPPMGPDFEFRRKDFSEVGELTIWITGLRGNNLTRVLEALPPWPRPDLEDWLLQCKSSAFIRELSAQAARYCLHHKDLRHAPVPATLKLMWEILNITADEPAPAGHQLWWEIVNVTAASDMTSSDRRPEQARAVVEGGSACPAFTSANAEAVGLPPPWELGLTADAAKDFVLWPVVYSQVRPGLGRWQASLGAQVVTKELRRNAFGHAAIMIDLVACHHQILLERLLSAKDANAHASSAAKVLRGYINNRQEYKDLVREAVDNQCSDTDAKILYLRILYGGSVKTWLREVLGVEDLSGGWELAEKIKRKLWHFLWAFSVAKEAMAETDEFKAIHSRLDAENTTAWRDKPNGLRKSAVLAHMLQDLEKDIMRVLVEDCLPSNYRPTALIHDGLMVVPRQGSQDEVPLNGLQPILEDCLQRKTGGRVLLTVEAMDE